MFAALKESLKRLWRFRREYAAGNLFFKVARWLVFSPVIGLLLNQVLKRARIFGLTDQTFKAVLTRPLSLFFGLLLLGVTAFSVYYEIGYYFLLARHQIKGEARSPKSIFNALNRKGKYFISVSTLVLMVYLLLLLPLANIGLSSIFTTRVQIPHFITDELLNTLGGAFIYLGVLVGLGYLALRLIYAIYFFVADPGETIKGAFTKSWRYTKGHSGKIFMWIALSTLVTGVITLGLALVCLVPLLLSETFLPRISQVTAAIGLTLLEVVIVFMGGVNQQLVINGLVGARPHEAVEVKEESQPAKALGGPGKKGRTLVGTLGTVVLVLLFAINMAALGQTLYRPDTAVIAHRGFMAGGVENTLGALQAAAQAGADMVELDIQETKDGQFAVIHDENLKRLAGLDEKVYDKTLAELEQITLYQNGFEDTIPSLGAFIDQAKALNIGLLIELKPHGHEQAGMEERLLDLIKEKDFQDDSIIQSLHMAPLDRIKALDDKMYTCYLIPILAGNLPETSHNFIGLEDSSVTDKALAQAAQMYEGLLVWTVNDEDLIKKYLNLDVEGLITNAPDIAVRLRDEEEDPSFFERIEKLLGI